MNRSIVGLAGVLGAAVFMTMACSAAPADSGEAAASSTESAFGEGGMVRGLASKCLDVQWGSTAPGTPVHLWPCTGNAAQIWKYTAARELRGLGGNCLQVRNGGTTAGTYAEIAPCNGGWAQKWDVLPNNEIRNQDGLCLDVQWGSTTDGTPIWTWNCTGNSAQLWKMDSRTPYPTQSVLMANTVLHAGESLHSPNGRYQLLMQSDCNLVLYDGAAVYEDAVWSSHTWQKGTGCFAMMQDDGNFVVYDQSWNALWSSGTYYYSGQGAFLYLQDDRNLVIYLGTRALWSSGTYLTCTTPKTWQFCDLAGRTISGTGCTQDDASKDAYQYAEGGGIAHVGPCSVVCQGNLVYAAWECCSSYGGSYLGYGCSPDDAQKNAKLDDTSCASWVDNAMTCN